MFILFAQGAESVPPSPMSDNLIIALAIIGLIEFVATSVIGFLVLRMQQKVEVVHLATNSIVAQLVSQAEEKGNLQGQQDERKRANEAN